ncbi:hypothetical protein CsSME_00027822 [Camellia sinensis var. sinensis]
MCIQALLRLHRYPMCCARDSVLGFFLGCMYKKQCPISTHCGCLGNGYFRGFLAILVGYFSFYVWEDGMDFYLSWCIEKCVEMMFEVKMTILSLTSHFSKLI